LGSDEPASSDPVASASSPIELASPAVFSTILEDNPEVPLINVHIPYEQHIEDTDAFIAFDSILDSDDLPTDRSAPIALYCRSGNMSAQASADLAAAGYTNVIDVDGGMNARDASGNSLLDDPTAADSE
jgi:phage shock protein E